MTEWREAAWRVIKRDAQSSKIHWLWATFGGLYLFYTHAIWSNPSAEARRQSKYYQQMIEGRSAHDLHGPPSHYPPLTKTIPVIKIGALEIGSKSLEKK